MTTRNTRLHEGAAVAAFLGLGLALAACATGNTTNGAPAVAATPMAPAPPSAGPMTVAPPPAAPSAAPVASGAPSATPAGAEAPEGDEHRHHPHGGIGMLIAMSLADLDLSVDQRTAVDKVKTDLAAKMEPARAAGKDLSNLLADGVAAGAVDRSKAGAAIDRVAVQVQAQQDASLDALNQLHKILDAKQRAALSDALTTHWSKWKEAQGHDEKDDGHHHSGHLLGLIKDLGLTRDQAQKIKTTFGALMKATPQEPEPAQARDHIKALGSTFKNDSFDARSLKSTPSAGASMAKWGAVRMERFLEAATPVLVADQRTRLAEMIRARAM